jgi:hypothetical protein
MFESKQICERLEWLVVMMHVGLREQCLAKNHGPLFDLFSNGRFNHLLACRRLKADVADHQMFTLLYDASAQRHLADSQLAQ